MTTEDTAKLAGAVRYRVFRRSANNWREFANARKYAIARDLTLSEARQMCAQFNDNRTPSQVAAGTKYEFTEQ